MDRQENYPDDCSDVLILQTLSSTLSSTVVKEVQMVNTECLTPSILQTLNHQRHPLAGRSL